MYYNDNLLKIRKIIHESIALFVDFNLNQLFLNVLAPEGRSEQNRNNLASYLPTSILFTNLVENRRYHGWYM
jgi:hypothetical protein